MVSPDVVCEGGGAYSYGTQEDSKVGYSALSGDVDSHEKNVADDACGEGTDHVEAPLLEVV
jgi:hypothetical protein